MFKVIQKAGLLIDVAQYIGDINRLYLLKERVVLKWTPKFGQVPKL